MPNAKKRDPEFCELLHNHATLDRKTGTVKFDGCYASIFVNVCWKSGIVSMPYAHLVWFLEHDRWPREGMNIDHINNDAMDNRPENLAEITHKENQRKRRGRIISRAYGTGKYGHGFFIYGDKRDGRHYVTRYISRGLGNGDLRNVKVALGGFSTLAEAEARVRECIEDIEAGREHAKRDPDRRRPDVELLKKLKTEGLTMQEISDRTGFCPATVFNHTKDIQSPERSKGTHNPAAKITENQVIELRRRYADGEKYDDLAATFGISRSTVAAIVSGRLWSHIEVTERSQRIPDVGLMQRLRRRGVTVAEIAKKTGFSTVTVSNYTKDACPRRRPDGDEIKRLRRDGLTLKQISDKTGFSIVTINKFTRDIPRDA